MGLHGINQIRGVLLLSAVMPKSDVQLISAIPMVNDPIRPFCLSDWNQQFSPTV